MNSQISLETSLSALQTFEGGHWACSVCNMLPSITYTTYGKCEAHCVEHSGGDCAAVEGIADALIITEKAPLIRFDFTQVKRCKWEAGCG